MDEFDLNEARGTFLEGLPPDERLELLDRAVASSENGIVIADLAQPDMPIVYVNSAFERLTGYPPAEVLGRNCRFLQGTDRDQPDLDVLRRAMRERRAVRVCLRNYRRSGAMFYNELHLAPVFGASGEATHYIGVQHDATRRLQAEAEARRLRDELERRVHERTRELARSNVELEARNSEQETFIYTVSHDLRAPLLSIQGMGALLAEAVERGDAEESRFLLSRVEKNVERMGRLLDDLLTLSRVGRAAEPAAPVDLGAAVAEVLAELEPRLKTRGVEVALPETWPEVLYPASELGQLLSNLLGNAAKFAGRPVPNGSGSPPRVAVSWSAGDGFVTLRVSDNGPGVRPEHRERVWGLFQKLDPKAEGTGVGLAIVKRIAERHRGKAWVEDSPPSEGLGGATFAVALPVERRQRSSEGPPGGLERRGGGPGR